MSGCAAPGVLVTDPARSVVAQAPVRSESPPVPLLSVPLLPVVGLAVPEAVLTCVAGVAAVVVAVVGSAVTDPFAAHPLRAMSVAIPAALASARVFEGVMVRLLPVGLRPRCARVCEVSMRPSDAVSGTGS